MHGNLYGTSYAAVQDVASAGKVCILDIDVQGCKSVREASDQALSPGAQALMPSLPHFLFVAPPSMGARTVFGLRCQMLQGVARAAEARRGHTPQTGRM